MIFRVLSIQPHQIRNLVNDSCSTCTPKPTQDIMSAPTIHCKWEDETVRERIGHPSDAEAKKMASLTLHTHSSFLRLAQGTALLLLCSSGDLSPVLEPTCFPLPNSSNPLAKPHQKPKDDLL